MNRITRLQEMAAKAEQELQDFGRASTSRTAIMSLRV